MPRAADGLLDLGQLNLVGGGAECEVVFVGVDLDRAAHGKLHLLVGLSKDGRHIILRAVCHIVSINLHQQAANAVCGGAVLGIGVRKG